MTQSLSRLFHSKERNEYVISDTVDFRSRKMTGIKRHYIMIKGSVCQEDIMNLKDNEPENTG